MSEKLNPLPVVMSITSLDPCGGAGISADIETLSSLGCHCTPVITRVAVRDTASVKDSQVIETPLLIEQIRAVLEDIQVNLIKVGDVGSVGNAEAVHTVLNDYPRIPVVVDPETSAPDNLLRAYCNLLLPHAKVVVMNEREARAMAPSADTIAACAQHILEQGSDSILITGGSGDNGKVRNRLFSRKGLNQQYEWPRLTYDCHGAGSTLSAALSGYLAHGLSLAESVQQAQRFTWDAIHKARRLGMGQPLPDRMHWTRK